MYPPLNDGYIRTNIVIVVRHSGDLVPAFETGGKEVERESRFRNSSYQFYFKLTTRARFRCFLLLAVCGTLGPTLLLLFILLISTIASNMIV